MRLGSRAGLSAGLIREPKCEFATAMRRGLADSEAGGLTDRKTGERDGLLCPIRLCALRDSGRYVAYHFIGELAAAGEPAPERLDKGFVPFTAFGLCRG